MTSTHAPASTPTVLYSVADGVAFITLNRPEKLNAIDLETHLLLADTLRRADLDVDNRAIVITGAGRGFCAGGDVGDMGGGPFGRRGRAAVLSPGKDLVDSLVRIEKPIIAMVNGVAAGLGATIALLCDIVIMSEDARIGDRHVPMGLVAGDGGAAIWPLLVGPSRAKELLMTGRFISAPEAAQIGLVSYVVPADELLDKTMQIAQELAALPPYAVQATKVAVNRIISSVTHLVLETSLAYEHISAASADHREAVAAFAEKRPGNYTGL